MKFRKEKHNKMKLGKFKHKNHKIKSDKQKFAYDCETSYGNSLLPTVTVSFKNVTSKPNPSEKLSKSIRPRSSLTQTTAPCDICHCKANRLFSLSQQGLIYFVCHNCYEKRHKRSGGAVSSFVDQSKFTINPQPRLKWEDICTTAEKFAPRLHKARKINRKNKKV